MRLLTTLQMPAAPAVTTLPPDPLAARPEGRVAAVWPDAVAYREAVQNPGIALGDPELRRAEVVFDRRGLPVAYSGRFAVVFRLREPAAGSEYALRCFTHASSGESQHRLRSRYVVMAEWAERHRPGYLAPFHYVETGIRVEGVWRPALVMRWAGGETLGRFVERRALASDGAALLRLAGALADLRATMESDGVSHGDWQHDNLLVTEGGKTVTLVDYDGLFVPALTVWPPPAERGHPNYQHPHRAENDFGPGRDRFAHLVLDAGLRALARDPGLWHKLGAAATGECVLFTRPDFLDPDASPVFAAVRDLAHRTGDAALGESVTRLTSACQAVLPLPAPVRVPPVEPQTLTAATPAEKWWLAPEHASRAAMPHQTRPAPVVTGHVTGRRQNGPFVVTALLGVSVLTASLAQNAVRSIRRTPVPVPGLSAAPGEVFVVQSVPRLQPVAQAMQDAQATQKWMARKAVAPPNAALADPFRSRGTGSSLSRGIGAQTFFPSHSVSLTGPERLQFARADYRDEALGAGPAPVLGQNVTLQIRSWTVHRDSWRPPDTSAQCTTWHVDSRLQQKGIVLRSIMNMRVGGKRTYTLPFRDGSQTLIVDVDLLEAK